MPEYNEDHLDSYGNPLDGSEIINCCFPDCGCDGARLCMAKNGASFCASSVNLERGSLSPAAKAALGVEASARKRLDAVPDRLRGLVQLQGHDEHPERCGKCRKPWLCEQKGCMDKAASEPASGVDAPLAEQEQRLREWFNSAPHEMGKEQFQSLLAAARGVPVVQPQHRGDCGIYRPSGYDDCRCTCGVGVPRG